jgi:hypothetical protein
MTHAHVSLIAGGVSTRRAAVLTGLVRSTATPAAQELHRAHARGVGPTGSRPSTD